MSPLLHSDHPTKVHKFVTNVVCLLGWLAIGVSALDLSAYGLAHFLNSDFLTPYFFCSDLLTGRYPVSGWTLSASPFFVPDLMLLGGLLGAVGQNGFAYILFTLLYYLALFALIGACVKTVIGRACPSYLASLLFGSIFMGLRFLPGHALYLWWIGAPFCHGGIFLLGFAYLWILTVGLRRGRIGAIPLSLVCLGLIGLISDTLFLFQVLLPCSVALFLGRRPHPPFARWLKWQSGGVLAALSGWQIFKLLCHWQSCFYFTRILRIVPTPSHQWHAVSQFLSALPYLLSHGWAFALLAVCGTWLLSSKHLEPGEGARDGVDRALLDFYRVFCMASLLIMLPLPLLSCLWRDENNIRYLWNWLVFPGFLLALIVAVRWSSECDATKKVREGEDGPSRTGIFPSTRDGCATRKENGARFRLRQWPIAAAAVIFLVCFGGALVRLRHEPLEFPYPDDVAKLDALLQERGLKFGLAEYWDAKYITALSHSGAELRQIRANGDLYFWDNNAFAYFEPASNGTLVWPAYQYILTNALDQQAVSRVFGEPMEKENAGRYQVWIYSDTGQRRIRELLEPVVRQKLGRRQ
jgi:hypothetical protein